MAPSFPPIPSMKASEIAAELDLHSTKHNFRRPTRSALARDPARPWKEGVPNYDAADLLFFRGRTQNHAPGSLEDVLENAVKTWEMEATHLPFDEWRSVDHGAYRVRANDGREYVHEEGAVAGNYNWLMDGVDRRLYDSGKETFESSHALFRRAFTSGFPWEVVKVFRGPPRIAFSWRHWGLFDGTFRGREGDDEIYDMEGWGLVAVDDKLKIQSIEIFYEPELFLKALQGEEDRKVLQKSIGGSCPFIENMVKTSLDAGKEP